MNKGKIWALSAMALLVGFTSCSDDEEWNPLGGGKVEMAHSSRAFILNEGSLNKNNSTIYYFDWSAPTDTITELYETQNGKKLGDTGNDILAVNGNTVVVAVNVSNYVALLDGYGVEKDRISFEQYKNLGQVRNVDEEGGIIYASSYGGYVSRIRINGDKLQYLDSLKVGERPEDVVESNGKLYVTLQGASYTDNRLAVVEKDFKTISYATIMTNPERLYAADGKIYVKGFGAMYNYPWGVYDPVTKKYSEIGSASSLGMGNGVIYLAYSATDWSTYETSTTLSAYDMKTGKIDDKFFKNVPEDIATASVYSISVNPYDGKIYLATSDYFSDGVVYVFDKEGNYLRTFTTGGLNPNRIVFLN